MAGVARRYRCLDRCPVRRRRAVQSSGTACIEQVSDVEPEDLLGRDPVELDEARIAELITGKTVLVTGAGGSIGSELCRRVALYGPAKLVLYELSEFALYQFEPEAVGAASSPATGATDGRREEHRASASDASLQLRSLVLVPHSPLHEVRVAQDDAQHFVRYVGGLVVLDQPQKAVFSTSLLIEDRNSIEHAAHVQPDKHNGRFLEAFRTLVCFPQIERGEVQD